MKRVLTIAGVLLAMFTSAGCNEYKDPGLVSSALKSGGFYNDGCKAVRDDGTKMQCSDYYPSAPDVLLKTYVVDSLAPDGGQVDGLGFPVTGTSRVFNNGKLVGAINWYEGGKWSICPSGRPCVSGSR